MLAAQSSSPMSRPIWVSLTETLTSTPLAAMRSSMLEILVARRDRLGLERDALAQQVERGGDPLGGELLAPPAHRCSIVSPATKREANLRASPFRRTKLKTPCRSESQSRPCRMITVARLVVEKSLPKVAGPAGGE